MELNNYLEKQFAIIRGILEATYNAGKNADLEAEMAERDEPKPKYQPNPNPNDFNN